MVDLLSAPDACDGVLSALKSRGGGAGDAVQILVPYGTRSPQKVRDLLGK
jgi:hypothetical protein